MGNCGDHWPDHFSDTSISGKQTGATEATMTIKLFLSAIIKFILGFALVAVLLFLPAGTLRYPNGWLLMGILFIPMFVAGIVR